MTLNAVIALILRFFMEFDRFSSRLYHSGWRYYTVRKILSPRSSLLLLAKTITHLQRGLSAIAEHLVGNGVTYHTVLHPKCKPSYFYKQQSYGGTDWMVRSSTATVPILKSLLLHSYGRTEISVVVAHVVVVVCPNLTSRREGQWSPNWR